MHDRLPDHTFKLDFLGNLTTRTDLSQALCCDLRSTAAMRIGLPLAAAGHWPLARLSGALERLGVNVHGIPLSYYRKHTFYTMRTDARDRFGTPLEQRFTRVQIESMMREAGLREIRFSEGAPYWCAVGVKAE